MTFPLESIEQMQGFFWVLMRVSMVLFLLPLFGAGGVPALWKAGLSFLLAAILTPVVPPPARLPGSLPEVILGLGSECILGLFLAFGARILLSSVQLAGQFMSFQMGFSMARAIDPVTGEQSTSLSQFLYLFTLLIFFAIDGHHMLIRALAASFTLVPLNTFTLSRSLSEALISASVQMFLVGLKIAAPIMIALFLSNLCLGIVARTVPQVNILMIGFPLNIGIGLIFFGLTLTSLTPLITELIKNIGELLMGMLRAM
ncbi:MAG: flagellar type III secretion system protein FliR [Deltaproteobacteria bacterium]|nr:flagellar type III secretion system protein FliR [Deltaproteobacteria bacterium]